MFKFFLLGFFQAETAKFNLQLKSDTLQNILLSLAKAMVYMYRSLLLLLISFGAHSQTVYKTPSGAKYHTAECRMVKNVSRAIPISDAIALGLQPCKICHPLIKTYSLSLHTKKAKGESNTVQCKGYTKAGTRCKHRTSIANGYCYQHQP